MVKHIVMWRLNAEAKARGLKETAEIVKKKLEDLKGRIPQIMDLEVGVNFSPADTAMDLVLFSTFADRKGLEAYQVHEEHQKVAGYIKSVAAERRVVDYEI